MPLPCKFKGYELLGPDEAFWLGDYYYPSRYPDLMADDLSIDDWTQVDGRAGPIREGQSFRDRHNVTGYTVIRKSTKKPGIPVRLALSKTFSISLPLP